MSDVKLILVAGEHGIGKTHENCNLIENYIKNSILKKILIIDPSDEYTDLILENNGFNFKTTLINISDLDKWSNHDGNFIGRVNSYINGKPISNTKFYELLIPYLPKIKDTLIVIEDFHKEIDLDYLIRPAYMNNSTLVISSNSLSYFSNILLKNAWFIRLHNQFDTFDRYRNRVELHEPIKNLISIMQKLSYDKWNNNHNRFFCYIDVNRTMVYGNFTKEEFKNYIDEYLKDKENKKELQYLYSCNGNKK